MSDQPGRAPESRIYRNRDALRVGSFASGTLGSVLAGYLLTQISGLSGQLGEVLKQLTDQGHTIAAVRQVQDDLHREMDGARREIDARLAACEARGVAHAARLEDLERLAVECRSALAAFPGKPDPRP